MFRAILTGAAVAAAGAGLLFGDFSYEQTSKITGGAMAGMMKMAGVVSRQAREPIRATVAVKGDRMFHGTELSGQIIDLGKETITTIDFHKKTWSVMTFAELTQALERMSQKMKESGKVNFKVTANATGQTRQIAGLEAKEMLLKMQMEGTDQQTGQTGGMVITTDMWLAPMAPGYQEVREFHRRMAEKLNWTPGSGLMTMGQPGIAKGMAEVYKEAAKLDGMPVLQEVKMGAEGQPAASQGQTQPTPQPQAQEQQQPAPSAGSALGSAIGGRFGLGKLGRKKKDDSDQNAQPANSQQPSGAPGSFMEMTTELSNFSSAPVDPSRFEVPAGFKQVENEMLRMAK